MPEVAINIGDKKFTVTCQPGEESALEAAASLLHDEASFLVSEIGQIIPVQAQLCLDFGNAILASLHILQTFLQFKHEGMHIGIVKRHRT